MAWPCPGAAFPQPASFSATLQMLQTPKPGSAGGAGLCPRRPQRRPPRPVIPGSTPGRPHTPAAARAPLGLHEGADVCALGGPSPHEQRALPAPWRGLFPGSHTWSSRPLSRSLLSRVPLDTRVQPLPSEGQGCVLPARSCCCTPWVDLWGAPLMSWVCFLVASSGCSPLKQPLPPCGWPGCSQCVRGCCALDPPGRSGLWGRQC